MLSPDHVKTALLSIHDLNYVADFGDWANCMRTYAVRGERGHLVESYPGGVPEHPMPYWSEVWTGLEYVYAIGLAQEGLTELAEDVVVAVRERFSGKGATPLTRQSAATITPGPWRAGGWSQPGRGSNTTVGRAS